MKDTNWMKKIWVIWIVVKIILIFLNKKKLEVQLKYFKILKIQINKLEVHLK